MKKADQKYLEGFWVRLEEAIASSGMSMRQISLSAGLSGTYISNLLKTRKEPTVGNLAAVCQAMGASLSYVLVGLDISPETEQVIQRLEKNPAHRQSVLSLLPE